METNNTNKLYPVSYLLELLRQKGMPSSRTWLYTVERQGRLVCPKLPNSLAYRVFTLKQIEEIIQAFSVGGKGSWKYEEN